MAEPERTDVIDVPAGIANLPELLRQIASRANKAGLEGLEVEGTSYGLNRDAAMTAIREERNLPDLVQFEIRYRRGVTP